MKNTAQSTEVSSNLLMWKFYGHAQFSQSFGRNWSETLPELCISTKFPHQEIRWNLANLRSEIKFVNQITSHNLNSSEH